MSITIINKEYDGNELSEIEFKASREDFKELVHHLADEIERLGGVDETVIIREGKWDPVIRTTDDDKVYFDYGKESSTISLNLARQPVRSVVIEEMETGDEAEGEHVRGRSRGRSPTEPDTFEAEDFAGDPSDEMESENGPEFYEDPSEGRRVRETEGAHVEDAEKGYSLVETDSKGMLIVPTHRQDEYMRGMNYRVIEERLTYQDALDKMAARGGSTKGMEDWKPYNKQDVDYHQTGEGPEPDLNCMDCVHYIEGGGCEMVKGQVDPEGYCESLYADFAFFGRVDGPDAFINLAAWGDEWYRRIQSSHMEDIVEAVRETLENKLG